MGNLRHCASGHRKFTDVGLGRNRCSLPIADRGSKSSVVFGGDGPWERRYRAACRCLPYCGVVGRGADGTLRVAGTSPAGAGRAAGLAAGRGLGAGRRREAAILSLRRRNSSCSGQSGGRGGHLSAGAVAAAQQQRWGLAALHRGQLALIVPRKLLTGAPTARAWPDHSFLRRLWPPFVALNCPPQLLLCSRCRGLPRLQP
mmetsp:Transcript_94971/g.171509  ORF Transcript_94971/g.171509 Transcript_94971/m.171509 type:complete len:201 (+) Transcript_94971:540-1142(+)